MIRLILVLILAAAGVKQVAKDSSNQLRHEVGNLVHDVAEAKARLESHEAVIESLRQDMENRLSVNKELVKGSLSDSTGKVGQIEKISKDLASDLIQLKKGVESSLSQLEKKLETQDKNLRYLETALKAVLKALGVEQSAPVAATDATYIVKEGDSLGKIASAHGTTTKALKEFNNLSKDTIRVGQKLNIP